MFPQQRFQVQSLVGIPACERHNPKILNDIKNEKFLWFQAKPPCGIFPIKIVIFTFVVV